MVAWFARVPFSHYDFDHSEKPNNRVECIVAFRESIVDNASQLGFERYAAAVSPFQQFAASFFADCLLSLSAKWFGETPSITFRRISLSDDNPAGL
jgi:hypothetical protein